jgi:carbon storage regulator
MLVLSRKRGDAVVIGGRDGGDPVARVTVLEIHGLRVKLGFEADSDVEVHRWEVWEQIRSENPTLPLVPAQAAPPVNRWDDDGGQ